ncbi:epoxyqueuosine reductase [Acetanaerobacterium elongatum]|uniref:Epoxyqueuosine reductase QueG (Queuosine biosynthesis) n=1 Tax=Acetanaerobacterium elongatum TaxID=258515 RepID=A0A1H0DFN5_9FIRM|nr:epoxyqueuosine reductase [Acetanaerobacterium elongatum]SDN68980.1 Epoxyqueuosine reductase QueG (queuosine biosynthesis) [Acetanaerobacterium elongatum]
MEQQIKELVLSLGADVCGIAGIGRFESAPEGFHPKDIYPDCKSVVVFGVALPKGLAKVEPRLVYGHYNDICKPQADRIALFAAKAIEERFKTFAVPVPSDNPYEYWDAEKLEGRGLISMKHAACLAGLGTFGKSTLLLNCQYGSLLTLGAVLTALDLASDPMADSICIAGCTRCIDSCPVQALDGKGGVNQAKCRRNTYGKNARGFNTVDCNRCRTVCPMRFGTQQQES